VLSHVGFIGVIAGQFHVLESIKRPVEITPEIEIMQDRIRLKRRVLFRSPQWLEMRFPHQRRLISVLMEDVPFALQG